MQFIRCYYDHTIRQTYLGHKGHGTRPTFTAALSKSEYGIAFSFLKLNNLSSSDYSRGFSYRLSSAFTFILFWVTALVTPCSTPSWAWCPSRTFSSQDSVHPMWWWDTAMSHPCVIPPPIPNWMPPKRRVLHHPY